MIEKLDIQNFAIRYIMPVVGCIAAAMGTIYILSSVNPLAAALLCAATIFCVIAVVTPRIGITVLLVLCGYSDLLKRLLIFWSDLTYEQISYVLAAAPLVVIGLIVAVVTRWSFHTVQITRRDTIMGVFFSAAMAASFLLEWRETRDFLSSAKTAVNSGLYVAMMPVTVILFQNKDDVLQMIRRLQWIFIPVAIYAIIQATFGFANFELEYLKTGLTTIVFEGVPRPFSTLNSAGAMGDAMATMAIFSLTPYVTRERDLPGRLLLLPLVFGIGYLICWRLFNAPFSLTFAVGGLLLTTLPFVISAGEDLPIRERAVPLLLFGLFTAACICSLVRHSYFVLISGLIGIFCFRDVWRTRIFYAAGVAGTFALVFSSSYLLRNLADWDPSALAGSEFGERALAIQTYAERLKGFSNLTSSLDMYSPFGLPSSEKGLTTTYHHDPISGVLVDYGVFALLIVVGGFCWLLYQMHRSIFVTSVQGGRYHAIMLLSIMFSILASHLLFYGVLSTFPINAFFWIFVGCLFCIVTKQEQDTTADLKIPRPTPLWLREAKPTPSSVGIFDTKHR